MSLDPLLAAPGVIQIHAFAAMAAFLLGIVQFIGRKGTIPHRSVGAIWVLLMLTVAISSFWIHEIRLVGPWSPIHLISIFTLVMLPLGVWRAHTHRVNAHKMDDDQHLHRRAGHCGSVHAPARAHHECGCVRAMTRAHLWPFRDRQKRNCKMGVSYCNNGINSL